MATTLPNDKRAPRRTGARSPRTQGRSARVVSAVMDATVETLARSGYDALRIEEVAQAAGVNKTTVYRRWPSKLELVDAAFRHFAAEGEVLPDTGGVRSDLIAFFRARALRSRTPARAALIRLITTERGNPEVAALAKVRREDHLGRLMTLVRRGIETGELPKATDPRLVAETIAAPIYLHTLHSGDDVAFVDAVIDLVLHGAGVRPAERAGRRSTGKR